MAIDSYAQCATRHPVDAVVLAGPLRTLDETAFALRLAAFVHGNPLTIRVQPRACEVYGWITVLVNWIGVSS